MLRAAIQISQIDLDELEHKRFLMSLLCGIGDICGFVFSRFRRGARCARKSPESVVSCISALAASPTALWLLCLLFSVAAGGADEATSGGFTLPPQTPLLFSAEFDYARLPREVWRERIIVAREAGFNALTIPVFWSLHEPQPGRFGFDGRRDFGHLLDLCRQERMWSIVRLGPCVEGGDWGLDGVPAWRLPCDQETD